MLDKGKSEDLVRAARAGSELAFAELVRAYQDVAVAYATAILGDRHLAEDAAQDAFVEAHRELPALREAGAFPAWFRMILRKHCDRLTRRKRHLTVSLDDALEVAAAQPSPLESLESREVELAVHEAIAALPESERAVVLLYSMGGDSQAGIAEFLDVTANTVKTRLYAARKRLRKIMAAAKDSNEQGSQVEASLSASRPSTDANFAGRVLSATLPLQLYFIDERGSKQPAGSVAGARSTDVPQSETWLIQPKSILSEKDWETVLGLMKEMRIPGLGESRQVTDAVLERVTELDHVTYLDLQGCPQLTDAGLRHLARLPRLRHLNLSSPNITDRGLEVLRHLPELQTFELYHQTKITDAGLAHLETCKQLRHVNLMGTRSGDGVVRALAGKSELRQFFAGNEITDRGLALFHQLPVFKTWLGEETALALMEFATRPNYLWLSLKAPFTDVGLANLVGLDGLFALNLFGGKGAGPFDASQSAVTPAGLRHLTELANLGWLGCCEALCTDDAMWNIAAMPGLRFLMCQDAVAGDDGFAALGRSKSIEYIWGRRCHNLHSRGFAALADIPTLRGLSVSCKNVDDVGLAALPRFPSLRELMPMDVPDAGFRHVGACERLEALYCMYCKDTTDRATEQITGLKLKTYQTWSTAITDRSLEILSRMTSLERLLFADCRELTDAGLSHLARLPRLRRIDFDGLPNVTPDAAALFPANVQVNVSTQ